MPSGSKPAQACPCCAGGLGSWALKSGYQLLRCVGCGSVATSPEQVRDSTTDSYAAYHQHSAFATPPEVIVKALEAVVVSATSYHHSGRWLDFGFGEGALLSVAERHGWACYGVEASPHALENGRRHGWKVTARPAEDAAFEPASFDVVTLIEVVEHLRDPIATLQQAVSWLRPAGLLYLTTPNAASLTRRLLGSSWSIFCPPEHWLIWSPLGMRRALGRVGLRRVRIRTTGFNPAEILSRIRRPVRTVPIHRQAAATRLNETLSRSRLRRAVKAGANHLLSGLRLGDTLKVWTERPE